MPYCGVPLYVQRIYKSLRTPAERWNVQVFHKWDLGALGILDFSLEIVDYGTPLQHFEQHLDHLVTSPQHP